MGKKIGIFAALACAFVLCFALVGCGSSAPDKSKFVGTWELESGSDQNLDASSISQMKSLGLQVTLTLKDDDTGSLNLFGDEMAVTWKVTENDKGTISMTNTGDANMKLSGDKLVMEDDKSSMTFVKQSAAAAAASTSAASASAASTTASAASASAAAAESASAASAEAAASDVSASAEASASAASASAEAAESASAESASASSASSAN